MERRRQLVFFKSYFRDFFEPLSDKVKNKIDQLCSWLEWPNEYPVSSSNTWAELMGYLRFGLNIKATLSHFLLFWWREISDSF